MGQGFWTLPALGFPGFFRYVFNELILTKKLIVWSSVGEITICLSVKTYAGEMVSTVGSSLLVVRFVALRFSADKS